MISESHVHQVLEKHLTSSRYEHVCRVKDQAIQLASNHDVVSEDVIWAALLHDLAKPFSPQSLTEIDWDQQSFDVYDKFPAVWHAFYGPQVIEHFFSWTSESVFSAIQWHTTGKPDMSTLDKIIYIADFIEPGRRQLPESAWIRDISYQSLDEACAVITWVSIQKLISKHRRIHPLTMTCFSFYLKKITDNRFSELLSHYERLNISS